MYALPVTLGIFGLILVASRLKVPLAVGICAGGITIGLLFGLAPAQVGRGVLAAAAQPRTIGLLVITVLLLGVTGTMRAGGQMDQIVSLTRAALRRPTAAMVALPALIGLLPMPGGALFSAPMVESAVATNTDRPPPALLSAVNYWFRHVWEYWWPLYPGVILAMTLTRMGLTTFVAFQFPLTLFMICGGLTILRSLHPAQHVRSPKAPPGTRRKLLRATSPIWVILLAWATTTAVLAAMPGETFPQHVRGAVGSYLPITLGLLVSLIWTARMGRLRARDLAKVFADKSIYTMVALVGSVMIFQFMLDKVDAPRQIGRELIDLHVPVVLVVAVLPFIAGMVTGLAVGFVGTSFPILLGLLAALPDAGPLGPYIALAYAFGHMGQMLSPMHLCHVMSNRYFKTRFSPVYRHILPAAVVTGACVVAYFVVLRILVR